MGIRHTLFSWFNRKLVRRTEWAWRHPAEAQREALAQILATHRGAGYLTDHGVGGEQGPLEALSRLPIVNYEELRPWIQPLVEQGSGAPGTVVNQPVSLFLKTSGTTGPAKLLPVTDAYEEEADRGRKMWIRAMLAEHDMNADGSHMTVVSPREESRTPGGLMCGSNTGRIFRRQLGVVQFFAPVPYEVFSIRDFDLRYYLILRYAAAKHDVRTFTTANSSTVLLLCRRMLEFAPEIAADIEAGRICSPERMERLEQADFGPLLDRDAALKEITWRTQRLPKRARVVREAAQGGAEGLLPRLWPKLLSVNCWLGGHAPFYLDRVRPFLAVEPGRDPVALRDPGFAASEGLFGIPLRSGTPEGVLHVLGAFMEFIPEEEDPRGPTLLAHELEVGGRYRIIVTTQGGLWRYDMNDIIEVTGVHHATPMVRFLYKAGGTLSVTGEKVTEAHAIAAATRLAAQAPIEQTCATLQLSDPPRYVVAIEPAAGAELARPPAELARLWDEALRAENVEYGEKRDSGRLAAPEARLVPEGTFNRWRRRRVAAGAPDGQVKLPPLLRSMEALERDLLGEEEP